MITIEELKKADVNQILHWLRKKGINLSIAQELQLAMLHGAGDHGIMVYNGSETFQQKINLESLLELINGNGDSHEKQRTAPVHPDSGG